MPADLPSSQTLLETVFSGLHLTELQLVIRDITPSGPTGAQSQVPVGEEHNGSDNALTHSDAAQAAPLHPADDAPFLTQHDEAVDRASFTLAENTLEDFDVHAFVRRLSTSIPTLENAIVSIGRPRRCGGAPRTGCLGERRDVSEMHIDGVGSSLCEELKALESERISRERGFNSTWASLSRAWQQGLRAAQ